MNIKINFWTPVQYSSPSSWKERLLENADAYFCLGGRKAVALSEASPGQSVPINFKKMEGSRTILKVISYMTLFIPILILLAKISCRFTHEFHVEPLTRGIPKEAEALEKHTDLAPDSIGLISEYLGEDERFFGAPEWQKYFGVSVGAEPDLPEEFYTWWEGPDPIDPSQRVRDTHYRPVFRPEQVVDIRSDTPSDYCRQTLAQLVKKPLVGPSLHFIPEGNRWSRAPRDTSLFPGTDDSLPINQHLYNSPGSSRWLVMRKDVIATDKPYREQVQEIIKLNEATKSSYEIAPSILDLSTIALLYNITGKAKPLEHTISSCQEQDGWNKRSLHGPRPQLAVGLSCNSGVMIDLTQVYHRGGWQMVQAPHNQIGIALVRRF